jgi:glucosylceramidase
VAHDEAYILPTIREALALNPGLRTIAASWSPPAWMKANHSPSNLAGRGRLLPQDLGVFARYLVRFVQAYRAAGVPIDAITPENEPGQQAAYPSLNLSEQTEATLIADDLAPELRAAGLSTRIYGLDWSWKYAPIAQALVRDRPVRRALAGIAWHCYVGNPSVMDALHRELSGGDQMETECSGGSDPAPTAELLIASFRNWASAVLLWNLALDPAGGPVEPPDYGCPKCTGVVTINPRTHTIRYNLDYYQLGQFSRFVHPGAQRIASNTFVADQVAKQHPRVSYVMPGLDDVAFQNPDQTDALLVHDNTSHTIRFAVRWEDRSFIATLPAEGTATFTWRAGDRT